MCGIAGFTGERDDALLAAMNTCIAHRGPDDADQFVCDDVSLAYRRLAIIDRATGDQPIFNEDESIVIVYNGETYNYRELRGRLEAAHTFRTNGDTETIVHLYEEMGPAAFRELNGMFGFALWDGRTRKLYLVRDRFGVKPLFYAERDGRLFFASEIKSLLKAVPPRPNDAQIYQYLMYRIHDHDENTFFAGIQRLLPGCYLEWQDGRSRIERYWEPDLTTQVDTNDEAELAKRFEKLFVQAVHRQLVSEVPVGSCLSGGLDSSSIVAVINSLIRKHVPEEAVVGERQKTFSAMFPGEANDETDYIHALTAKLPVDEHGVYPKKDDMFDELEQVVYHQDEPFVTTAIFAQWEVMKEASKHVTVTLDGQGADELLAGYFPYYVVYLRQLLKERKYWTALKEMVLSADVLISWSVEPLKERFKLARTVDAKVMLDRSWLKSREDATTAAELPGQPQPAPLGGREHLQPSGAAALRRPQLDGVQCGVARAVHGQRPRRLHPLAAARVQDQERLEQANHAQGARKVPAGEDP